MAEGERLGRAKRRGIRARNAALFTGATVVGTLVATGCARLLDIGDLGVAAGNDAGPLSGAGTMGDAHALPYMIGYVLGNNPGAPATVESWLGRPLDIAANSMSTVGYIAPAPYATRDGGRPLLEINFPVLSIYDEPGPLDDMAVAASGGYDATYTSMAQALASWPDPLLAARIGAQFNSGRYPWGNGVGKNATYANYVAAFKRIAIILRTVNPGVLIEWCVTWGGADPAPYWPGKLDAQTNPGGVDVVSMVLYESDIDSGAWSMAQSGGTVNVDWMVKYAQEEQVKIALSEYGAGTADSGGAGSGPGRDDGAWTADSIAWMNAQPAGFFLWELWSGFSGVDDLVTPGANPAEEAAWTSAWRASSFAGDWWDGAPPP